MKQLPFKWCSKQHLDFFSSSPSFADKMWDVGETKQVDLSKVHLEILLPGEHGAFLLTPRATTVTSVLPQPLLHLLIDGCFMEMLCVSASLEQKARFLDKTLLTTWLVHATGNIQVVWYPYSRKLRSRDHDLSSYWIIWEPQLQWRSWVLLGSSYCTSLLCLAIMSSSHQRAEYRTPRDVTNMSSFPLR